MYIFEDYWKNLRDQLKRNTDAVQYNLKHILQ